MIKEWEGLTPLLIRDCGDPKAVDMFIDLTKKYVEEKMGHIPTL